MKEVRLGIVQSAIQIGQVKENLQMIDTMIHRVAKDAPDIIVLPETWNTGFMTGPDLLALADPDGRQMQERLSGWAKELHVNIVGGSVAIEEDGKIYNRTYVYNREGELVSTYDKMHGFSPAKEDLYFTGGTQVHRFTLDGILCSSATCYDIRFPELIRKAALSGVELFFLPAQWPLLRLSHWKILNQARAIENQMFFCGVNGCGRIGKLPMAGHSVVVDPWGEIQLELEETEAVQTITIDLDVVADIRAKINVFRDRRPSLY